MFTLTLIMKWLHQEICILQLELALPSADGSASRAQSTHRAKYPN